MPLFESYKLSVPSKGLPVRPTKQAEFYKNILMQHFPAFSAKSDFDKSKFLLFGLNVAKIYFPRSQPLFFFTSLLLATNKLTLSLNYFFLGPPTESDAIF